VRKVPSEDENKPFVEGRKGSRAGGRLTLDKNGIPQGWKILAQKEGYALISVPLYDLIRLKELRIWLESASTDVEPEDAPKEISIKKRTKLREKYRGLE
jgi:hypothetical protein